MPVIIPTRLDFPHYAMSVTLEGTSYGFTFRWNTRAAAWYMAISSAAGTVLAQGIKIVLGVPLADRRALAEMPPGLFFAIDTSGRDVPPGIDDFGSRVQLYYLTVAEAEALADG